ncbi:MAG: ATP-grasp domain-containing protein [Chloroflexi bacterium]|nr:ATP-grasp domain-containing protein [Chloroflexota bacterium]
MSYQTRAKTILILGAGPDQLLMYKAARRLGLRIIGADGRFDSIAKPLCDRFLHIQSVTGKEIIHLLGDDIPDGVVSPGNDSFHRAIYHLTQVYNLPQIVTAEAMEASSNKAYFCEQARQHGVFAPQGKSSKQRQVLEAYAQKMGVPLIVKPIDSSGNKGVTCVRTMRELGAALDLAFAVSPQGHVIVEEYIDGEHGGMELFRINSETKLMAISQRHHSGPPGFLTLKHIVGLPRTDEMMQKFSDAVNRICDVFGIMDGPLNLDFVIRDGDIYFLEMGARLSGNGFPFLVKQCYGWDTYELVLRTALGELHDTVIAPPVQRNIGGIFVIKTAVSGTLQAFHHLDTIRQHPAYVEEHLFAQPGDRVTSFSQANHRLGYFMVVSPYLSEIQDMLKIFNEQFSVIVQVKEEEKVYGY